MEYAFTERIYRQGNRYFIRIPFNVYEKCNKKGVIPVRVMLEEAMFECRLIPKGDGFYVIPVSKAVAHSITCDRDINVSFEIIPELTRINHDSPYTIENPIRKIDHIERVTYPKPGYCGQCCIAMLTGLPVEEVIAFMQAKAWQCSFSKVIEALNYFGIAHEDKLTYTNKTAFVLPKCCIVTVRGKERNHFALYYKGTFYDTMQIDFEDIIGYLKIEAV